MKMWRPEQVVQGPRVATPDDVGALNRVFADAFTDRYRRDGLVGVRVPQLNAAIWRYAIQDAGHGAMLWHDEHGEIVAFNIAHCSGAEGWMGPLAVRTDRQGLGLGRTIVESAISWLEERRVTTLGLETMPRTVDNIGFYGRLGFLPTYLTVTMTADVQRRSVAGRFVRLREQPPAVRDDLIARCRERLAAATGGYDFSREMELTAQLDIGDTVLLEERRRIAGFALWHSAPLADVRTGEELRVLKLFADSDETFARLLTVLDVCAAALGVRRVAVRAQTAYVAAYRRLLVRGYRVRWTDLRMTLAGAPEVVLPKGAVLFSNWEI